jgi:hypothetical protein
LKAEIKCLIALVIVSMTSSFCVFASDKTSNENLFSFALNPLSSQNWTVPQDYPNWTLPKSPSDLVDNEIKVTTGKGLLMTKVGYSEAQPSKTYLVLPLQIENLGYNSVDYNPWYCKVTVNNVQYNDAFIGYSLAEIGYPSLDDMVTLKNGGKIEGYMGFEVPKGTTYYEFVFEPVSFLEEYNIVYVKG